MNQTKLEEGEESKEQDVNGNSHENEKEQENDQNDQVPAPQSQDPIPQQVPEIVQLYFQQGYTEQFEEFAQEDHPKRPLNDEDEREEMIRILGHNPSKQKMEEYSKEKGVPYAQVQQICEEQSRERPMPSFKYPSGYGGNYGEFQRRRGRPRKHESVSHHDLHRKVIQCSGVVDQLLQIQDQILIMLEGIDQS